MLRSALTRVACCLAFWIVVAGIGFVDLIVGALAAIVATWVSLRLLPPASRRVSFAAMCTFVPRFLYQSIVAGVDVALRALNPRLPLRPGFVIYPMHLPPSAAQSAFCTITGLLPRNLAVRERWERKSHRSLPRRNAAGCRTATKRRDVVDEDNGIRS